MPLEYCFLGAHRFLRRRSQICWPLGRFGLATYAETVKVGDPMPPDVFRELRMFEAIVAGVGQTLAPGPGALKRWEGEWGGGN